jgi:hypothetical protein
MKLYAGIDLHSNNNFLAISDIQDKRVYQKMTAKSGRCRTGRVGAVS